MSRLVISGAQSGVASRLEIHDFVKIEDQFSLYIQALQYLYDLPQDDIKSFFQIGGIHGLPYIPWNGSGEQSIVPGSQGGYCTHGSVLFPTWHRPYVLLFEQVLQRRAEEIAETYTVDKARWQSAAANLRQPYWDWAAEPVPPAEVISLEQVTIITPDGNRTAVDNPLRRYKFHPIDSSFERTPYAKWPTTVRRPSGPNGIKEDITALTNDLNRSRFMLTWSTYNLLTLVKDWPAFSNGTVGRGGATTNSLEAIHDHIHGTIGQGVGHMGDPAVAGFDPIFYLHHAQVDRLLSLWSAINPDVWVSKATQRRRTFTTAAGAAVDEKSALTPFWSSQTDYWASEDVQDTITLGYTYPELAGLDLSNKEALAKAVQARVDGLYAERVFGESLTDSIASAAPTKGSGRGGSGGYGVSRTTDGDGESGNIWDWSARIEAKKYELGSSFSVLFFLGEVPGDSAEWRTSPYYAGSHYAFVNTAASHCAHCNDQVDIEIECFVPLNVAISQHSGLGSYEPSVVEPYLKRQLQWRVQKLDGTVVELKSLDVSFIATPLTLPPGAIRPIPGRSERHRYGDRHEGSE